MKSLAPLQPGVFYHIYNRGNNGEDLFREERNYPYFIKQYSKYIIPIADTYAYCLLKNHFHFLVRIKTEIEIDTAIEKMKIDNCSASSKVFDPSKNFSNLFDAYAKALNKSFNRTGALFERPFKRIPVFKNPYLWQLIFYIHFNPEKHGFVKDFRDWRWSSYNAIKSTGLTNLMRDDVIELFGGRRSFEECHRNKLDEKKLAGIIIED